MLCNEELLAWFRHVRLPESGRSIVRQIRSVYPIFISHQPRQTPIHSNRRNKPIAQIRGRRNRTEFRSWCFGTGVSGQGGSRGICGFHPSCRGLRQGYD